jgi:hypothetical protein
VIPLTLLATACARGVEDKAPPIQEAAPVAAVTLATSERFDAKPVVHVWKSPTCGCCEGWVEHLRAAGYPVQIEDVMDIAAIKREKGVPAELHACHTAMVDGYLVEGHVPADVVDRMLSERPMMAGIAVPGMPVGSPGMEVPGTPAQPYEVIAFTAHGEKRVYDRR